MVEPSEGAFESPNGLRTSLASQAIVCGEVFRCVESGDTPRWEKEKAMTDEVTLSNRCNTDVLKVLADMNGCANGVVVDGWRRSGAASECDSAGTGFHCLRGDTGEEVCLTKPDPDRNASLPNVVPYASFVCSGGADETTARLTEAMLPLGDASGNLHVAPIARKPPPLGEASPPRQEPPPASPLAAATAVAATAVAATAVASSAVASSAVAAAVATPTVATIPAATGTSEEGTRDDATPPLRTVVCSWEGQKTLEVAPAYCDATTPCGYDREKVQAAYLQRNVDISGSASAVKRRLQTAKGEFNSKYDSDPELRAMLDAQAGDAARGDCTSGRCGAQPVATVDASRLNRVHATPRDATRVLHVNGDFYYKSADGVATKARVQTCTPDSNSALCEKSDSFPSVSGSNEWSLKGTKVSSVYKLMDASDTYHLFFNEVSTTVADGERSLDACQSALCERLSKDQCPSRFCRIDERQQCVASSTLDARATFALKTRAVVP